MKSFFKNIGTFSWVLLLINFLGVLIMAFTITFTQREAYSSIYSSYSRTVTEPSPLGIAFTIAALIASIVLHLILLGISRIGLKIYENDADGQKSPNCCQSSQEEIACARVDDSWIKNRNESDQTSQTKKTNLAFEMDAIRSKIDKAFSDRGTKLPEYHVEVLSGEPTVIGYLPERHTLIITNHQIELSAPSLSDYFYYYFSCIYEACSEKTLVDPAKYVQRISDAGNAWQEDEITYTFEFDHKEQLFVVSAVKTTT